MQTTRLNNGIEMPVLGYGVFQITDHKECQSCVRQAIRDGYHLFDIASAYYNEQDVGKACREMVKDCAVSREDLFLTTKVWLQDYGDGKTTQSVERSLKKMGMEYLDLVLLHQPFGNWQAAWRELEELSRSGLVRAIGVSNFTEKKLEELLDMAQIIPAVNQIERHPFYTEDRYIARMKRMGVQAESWGALCEGLKGIFHNPVLTRIGERYGKSAAQVAIRWNIQTGCIALIKSVRPEKMKEDIEVFDFALTQDEIREIASLDAGHSEIIDLENPVTERLLLKAKLLA